VGSNLLFSTAESVSAGPADAVADRWKKSLDRDILLDGLGVIDGSHIDLSGSACGQPWPDLRRRQAVNAACRAAHQLSAVAIGQPVGNAERLDPLFVGQQLDRACPVGAPHAAVEAKGFLERIPNTSVAMSRGLFKYGPPLRNRWFADSPLERAGFEPSVPGESGFDFAREVRGRLFAVGERIRTFGSAMRLHRRQRGRGVTPPSGEWRLVGPPPDNSIGMPRPATARMTGAPVDQPQLKRTRKPLPNLARN
jgi:hypothetical protein